MNDLASVRAIVYGRVQGVFFRAFVSKKARGLDLTGYVRNLPDGNAIEIHAEGERKKLEKLVKNLESGPVGAVVKKVVTTWSKYGGLYLKFNVKY